MNLWAAMLADLPATGQRVIARAQRISLPRGCDAATRLSRLRQALCHAATVRAGYALLDPAAQDALQQLRGLRGGISPAGLEARYGAIRSWRDLDADPRPRTISEQLLLLGWLLPRSATPRHPPHYLVPPEVRRWLPVPLPAAPARAPALPTAHLPALRAATLLLLAASDQPLGVTAAGTLRRAELRRIAPRLAPLYAPAAALCAWLVPLLIAQDWLGAYHGRATTTLAGQRFLALPPDAQRDQLRAAWVRCPDPDPWLVRLLVDSRGIDWPLLRRRLCAWAAAIPADDGRDLSIRYADLARSFGPLADAQTHGFRAVDRAPWQPKRAAAVLEAARVGPLAWLGLLGVTPADPPPDPAVEADSVSDGAPGALPTVVRHNRMRQSPRPAGERRRRARHWRWPDLTPHVAFEEDGAAPPAAPALASPGWRYGAPGVIVVPHAAMPATTLRLLPFVDWDAADADVTHYRITPASLACARGLGNDPASCRQLLEAQAGPLPEGWCAALEVGVPALRLVRGTVLLAENPAVLARAYRVRSVRRYLQRLAPGIALVRPGHAAALVRALARQGIACTVDDRDDQIHTTRTTADDGGSHLSARVRPSSSAPKKRSGASADLSPGDHAALLLACAFYRQHAPADAPLLPYALLEEHLRRALTPALRDAVDAALAAITPADLPAPAAHAAGPGDPAATLRQLRDAVDRQRLVELTYYTATRDAWNRRIVRPLALEQRGQTWYLHAYCTSRRAERTFRVDRIAAIVGRP